ncbi:MAG: response regulator [Terracidiphilus sp.]|nr:response regulator [Terracidiphilus sp.]
MIDSNENRLSIRRYLLATQGFAVISATSGDEAREICAVFDPDLIVACWPLAGADLGKLLDELHAYNPAVHSLLLAEQLTAEPDGIVADAKLLKGACAPVQIVERVKMLSAGRRGPKKTVQSVDYMMALAQRRIA